VRLTEQDITAKTLDHVGKPIIGHVENGSLNFNIFIHINTTK
jgi:hypothetical protein